MNTQTTQNIQATRAAQSSPVSSASAKSYVAAIFLMAAGWGWNSGLNSQPLNTSYGPIADALHVVPLVILLLLLPSFVGSLVAGTVSRGARNGITAIAVLAVVICIVAVVIGVGSPDPNSFGTKNPEDWMLNFVLLSGPVLWFVTLIRGRRAR